MEVQCVFEKALGYGGCAKLTFLEIRPVKVPIFSIFQEKVVCRRVRKEETLLFYYLMFDIQERPFWTALALESYSNGLKCTSSTGTEKMAA